MPRTPANVVRHELIGLSATLVGCTDDERTGLTGTVVNETEKTLVLETDGREVTVPKDTCTFRFALEEGDVDVEGDLLVGRPEERILKKFPRKWEHND